MQNIFLVILAQHTYICALQDRFYIT